MKIIAVFLIVISHVVQTLGENYGFGTFSDYVIELGCSTTDITTFILNTLRYFGGLGNNIFFICTAWFMVDRKPRTKKKILTIIIDVWVISMIVLVFVFSFRTGNLGGNWRGIIHSFFPVMFGNNWYITCYILFCLVHPYVNMIIDNLKQHELLRATVFMALVYILLNYVVHGLFFVSNIIIWIAVYFLTAYCKKYTRFINKLKCNILMLIVGILGNTAIILITNYLGFKLDMFNDKLLYWHQNNSPFLIMMAFGLLNIFRRIDFKNSAINYISGLSLYIYLFHENPLFAIYCRSAIWHEIFIRFGHENVLMWVLIYSMILFAVAAVVSMIYQKTVHQLVLRISDNGYPLMKKLYLKAENYILRFDIK